MTSIHFHQTTTATPEQFVAGLANFGPGRSKVIAGLVLSGLLATVAKGSSRKAFVNGVKTIEARSDIREKGDQHDRH